MSNQPLVSIIIPVHNESKYIKRCLDALIDSSYPTFEIITVDDYSTDDSIAFALRKGIKVLRLSSQSGPAFARNFGARHAKGDILIFIDSDVVVRRETIELIIASFQQNPDVAAVFGSYDDDPAEGNFISQYKNLFNHFHHQNSNTEASTFWSGCGAIRKKVFEEMGGFNQRCYRKASIEDIELGYRIRKKGYRILLKKGLQVKHLKRWGFLSMLRTDIYRRAIPWSCLILKTKFMPKDLNLQIHHIISAIIIALMILASLFMGHAKFYNTSLTPVAGFFLLIFFINFLFLNRKLYAFYARRRGLCFMVRVIPCHFLYYFYSGMSFVFYWTVYRIPAFISSILW
jgi:glycosyltransferase involved in cell wall biosynthesis